MQIKIVHSFLELYKTGNISRTSSQLYMTQQGLSRQIKALEEELGVILFIRNSDGVTPTEICDKLYPYFADMYHSYEELLNTVKHDHAQNRPIRIGFAYGISHALSNDFLLAYQNAYPAASLGIQEWSGQICQEKLLDGELDLAILIAPFNKALLSSQTLCSGNMYIAMHRSHPLAASSEPLPFPELKNERIITGSYGNALRLFFDYCCTLTRVQPKIIMSTSYSKDFVNSMADSTCLCTLTFLMAQSITNPDICIRKLILPTSGDLFICSSRQSPNTGQAGSFIKFSVDFFRKHPLENQRRPE